MFAHFKASTVKDSKKYDKNWGVLKKSPTIVDLDVVQ